MKSVLLAAAVALLSTNTIFAQAIKSLPIGSEIPNRDDAMRTTTDGDISFQRAKTDNGLLVMFSCNTCPYVIKSQPRTIKTIEMAKKLGVGMVIINSNEAQRNDADSYVAMQQYAQKQKYSVPYAMDDQSRMADAFGATRTPEVFLFDKDGKLVYKGAMEDNPSEPEKSKVFYLNTAMNQMVKGQKIAMAETKSIGCSIKRADH